MIRRIKGERTMYTDSHCHITCDDLYKRIDEVIDHLDKVKNIMIMCTNEVEFQRALALKKEHPSFKVAWGWYPEDAKEITEAHYAKLQEAIDQKQIDCLGEIGLDYYWDTSFVDAQKEMFIRQIKMANEANLPISIHMRDSTKDCLDILRTYAKTKIIFHCFSGSKETMAECLKMDSFISFAGPVTFKNAKKAVECATICPLDRLLTETDSPYMTPTPYRGKQNEPMYVEFTTKKICELKQLDEPTVVSQIDKNFNSLF